MSLEVEKLGILDIINKVGFLKNINDLQATYKFDSSPEEVIAFEKELFSEINNARSYSKNMEIIKKYESLFDKKMYVFRAGRLLENVYQMSQSPMMKAGQLLESPVYFHVNSKKVKFTLKDKPNTNIADKLYIKETVKYCKEALANIDILDLVENEDGTCDMYFSQNFIGNKSKLEKDAKKSEKRLKEIEKKVGLEKVLKFLVPTDLIDIAKYPNLGNRLAKNILESMESEEKDDDKVTVFDRVFDKEIEISEETLKKSNGRIFKWENFINTVRENIRYIDIDKMLTLSSAVFYNKYGSELDRFTHDEVTELSKYAETIKSLIESPKKKVTSPRFSREFNFEIIKNSITSLNKHFIGKRFYNDEEISNLANQIMAGKSNISNLSNEEILDIMQFTIGEYITIANNNPNALKDLNERGILKNKQLSQIISGLPTVSSENLLYIYQLGEINNDEILERYEKNQIKPESIKFLKENIENKEDLEKMVSSKKLVELYLDEEKREEFDKYRRLYKLLIIDDKDKEKKKEIANEILDQSIELLDTEKMSELYRIGLIPVDTYIDFNGESTILDLYQSGELKPIDVRRLYDEQVITLDMIKGILSKDEIEDGQKLSLLYSTFSKPEDAEIREDLIKYLEEPEERTHETNGKRKSSEQKSKKSENSLKNRNRAVTDPCARWNLIAQLDKDYSQEYLKDGNMVFYLPNQGKYIIEKLYNKNYDKAYGSATYILDEEEFSKNRNFIIEDRTINKSELVKLRKNKKADRIIHTGWSNGICRYFDIENSTKYTKEQTENIKKLAKQVESSKEFLDR